MERALRTPWHGAGETSRRNGDVPRDPGQQTTRHAAGTGRSQVSLDYAIVVPSRKRVHNMQLIRALLPTALICIDERERDDYLSEVPATHLFQHPPMDGLPAVLNWAMDAIPNPILIVIDD